MAHEKGQNDSGERRNEVVLRGRVTMAGAVRELPSGDALVSGRIVVDRGSGRERTAGVRKSRQPVDAIDCVGWTAAVRRAMLEWQVGDAVRVTGALRRRFYRAESGPVSRVEVEVLSVAPDEPVSARRRASA